MYKSSLFLVLSFIFTQAQHYGVSSIPKGLKKNASAVIRKSNTVLTINEIDEVEYDIHSVKTILSKDAKDFATPYLSYSKGDKFSKLKVVIYDKYGKVKKTFKKSDFKDYASNSQGVFYSDSRYLVLPFVATDYPFTIEFSYRYKTENTVFIGDFIPFGNKRVSLEKSNYTIHNNSWIKLRSKVYPSLFNYTSVKESKEGTTTNYSYENVPAIDKEDLSPEPKKILPKVSFALEKFNLEGEKGEITSWEEFGKWYYENLLKPVEVSTPQIKAEIQSLKLTGSKSDKVKKIYQFMQNKTRYIFVSLGIGGWQPMLPEEVQEKGYGDCKGLTNYMKTLLDEAGIKSYYTIINSNSSPIRFDEGFPKMGGNHVILMVPTEKGDIWLENTSQLSAFNHLSFNTTNRNALMIKPQGIELVETPKFNAKDNTEVQNITINLKENLSISGKGDFSYQGSQYDYRLPLVNLNDKDRVKAFKNIFNIMDLKGLNVTNFENDRDVAVLKYSIDFTSDNYAKSLGNSMIFRAVPFFSTTHYNQEEKRALPFEIRSSYEDTYNIEYVLPEGYEIDEIPQNINIKSEFGFYNLQINKSDGKLLIKRILNINRGLYAKEKYNDYVSFRNKIIMSDKSKILITKS